MFPLIGITHQRSDLDGLASLALIAYLHPRQPFTAQFANDVATTAHDGKATFVVDCGHSPFDHHHHANPAATCAFALTCAHFIAHGNVWQRGIAQVLHEHCTPTVLRQDQHGSVTFPYDSVANAVSLPQIIGRLHRHASDEVVWSLVWPLLKDWFDAARRAAHHAQTRDNAIDQMVVYVSGNVVALSDVHLDPSDIVPCSQVWRRYPNANICCYAKHYRRSDGSTTSWSVGIGRRSTSTVDMRPLRLALLKRMELAPALRAEIGSWYAAEFFCGRGGLKYPNLTPPPAQCEQDIALALTQLNSPLTQTA